MYRTRNQFGKCTCFLSDVAVIETINIIFDYASFALSFSLVILLKRSNVGKVRSPGVKLFKRLEPLNMTLFMYICQKILSI